MVFDGLKPMSAKILVLLTALFFFFYGTNFVKPEQNIASATVMVALAVILAIEVGLKLVTNLSELKRLGIVQYVSLVLVIVLLIGASYSSLNITAPDQITSIINYTIAGGSVWLVAEAFL